MFPAFINSRKVADRLLGMSSEGNAADQKLDLDLNLIGHDKYQAHSKSRHGEQGTAVGSL